MPEITPAEFFQAFIVHVAVAIACGGVIGAERQLRGKNVGLRVCILIVLTSAFFVTIAMEVGGPEEATRVLASLVTGVGFLGAGVIFSQGGKVQGITTATLIWALAAIGAVIGFGHPWTAAAATITVVGVMVLVDAIEAKFPELRREHERPKSEDTD